MYDSASGPVHPQSSPRTISKERSSSSYVLENYLYVDTLGHGSFATVNKVVHRQTGRTYAMKTLKKSRVVEQGLEEQLKREVVTQIKAKHPNVVRMFYYFEEKEQVSCLLEFADKGQLYAYLKRYSNGIPEPRAAAFLADTARGIQYLHSLDVIHRDIKPENILLFTDALTCKIADLGYCVALTKEMPERQTICGTMDYLPPEMLCNKPHDLTVDLWALGVLLFEMLVGHPPFVGSSPKDVVDRICNVEFEIPKDSMSAGPAEIIHGCLVRDHHHRWSLALVLSRPWVTSLGVLSGPVDLQETLGSGRTPLKPVLHAGDHNEFDVMLEATRVVGRKAGKLQPTSKACEEDIQLSSNGAAGDVATEEHQELASATHGPSLTASSNGTRIDDLSTINDTLLCGLHADVAAQREKQIERILDAGPKMGKCSSEPLGQYMEHNEGKQGTDIPCLERTTSDGDGLWRFRRKWLPQSPAPAYGLPGLKKVGSDNALWSALESSPSKDASPSNHALVTVGVDAQSEVLTVGEGGENTGWVSGAIVAVGTSMWGSFGVVSGVVSSAVGSIASLSGSAATENSEPQLVTAVPAHRKAAWKGDRQCWVPRSG